MTVYTFQTVKLSLEAWHIVDQQRQTDQSTLSEAMEKLIRHGSIRLARDEWQQPALSP